MEDINSLKKRIEELEEANKGLTAVFDAMDDLVFVIDKNNVVIEANEACIKFLKANREDMIGRKCHELVHKLGHPWPGCPFEDTKRDRKPHTEEVNDPNVGLTLLVTTSPIFDDNQEMIGAVHVAKDITARKKAEKALEENEHKLRAILDQTFQFIGLMNLDGVLIDANRTALDFAGVEASAVIGKPFWETPWWTHSRELQNKLCESVKKASRGEMVHFEATHVDKNGTIHYVDFSLKPVKDENGKVIFLIPEGRDITDYKKVEEALRGKMKDLEIFHKVAVGREMKITELKKKVKDLESQLGEV